MRVGILSQWFPPETGPASIPGVLAKGLAERGHDVRVLTGFPNYPTGMLYEGFRMGLRHDSVQEGYKLRRVALYPDHSSRLSGRVLNYGSFAASATALGTAAFKGIDVLWVYNSPATVAFPMWATKSRFHVPIVLHVMDMWPDSVIHSGFARSRDSGVVLKALTPWVNAMYRSAAIVAHLTPAAGQELRRRGVPSTKLAHAPVWVDESVFKPADGTQLRRELGFSDGDVVLGYAGAIGRAQSVVALAEAVAETSPASRIRCLILGSGIDAPRVKEIADRSLGRVIFIGQVPHSAMTEYAAVPDISYVGLSNGGQQAFAAPSKIPAIMACARPLIAEVGGDSAALIHQSGAGWVIRPGDAQGLGYALRTAAAQGRPGLRRMGAAAREYYLKNLSAESGIARVESLLQNAILRSSTCS